jgi:hypothetical protein
MGLERLTSMCSFLVKDKRERCVGYTVRFTGTKLRRSRLLLVMRENVPTIMFEVPRSSVSFSHHPTSAITSQASVP